MKKLLGSIVFSAIGACVAGCTPIPDTQDYWALQRPIGVSIQTRKPPRELDQSSSQVQRISSNEMTGTLVLKDALAAAILHNPELARFGYDVRAAEAQVVQAGLWPNPELGLEIENFSGTGDFKGAKGAEVTLVLSQTFPLGGDIKRRKELASLQGQLAGWDYEAARVALLTQVTQRYVNVLAAQSQLKLAQESSTLALQMAESIGRRVDAGDAPQVERSRAAVPVATTKIALQRAMRSLESAHVQLALTWGSSSPAFDSVAGDIEKVHTLPAVADIVSLISQNPDVARWVTQIASRQAEIELARAEAVPDLTAGLGYRWFNESDDSALVGGVSIPLPLFDRRQGDILAKRFGMASARNQQRAVELRIEAAVAGIYAKLANAYYEATALRDEAIGPASRAYQDIKKAFDRGNISFLDVLDAERTLIDLRQQYLNALAQYHGSAAELEGLIGQPLTSIAPSTTNAPQTSTPAAPKDSHKEINHE